MAKKVEASEVPPVPDAGVAPPVAGEATAETAAVAPLPSDLPPPVLNTDLPTPPAATSAADPTAETTAKSSAPSADDDAEYLAGVLRKQVPLVSIEDGRTWAARLPKDVAAKVVALGRTGRVSELRALLKQHNLLKLEPQ